MAAIEQMQRMERGPRADLRPQPPLPHQPQQQRQRVMLVALRVLLQQRVLRWALHGRYHALLRWRAATTVQRFVAPAAPLESAGRLQDLLREVAIMKAAVGNTVGPT